MARAKTLNTATVTKEAIAVLVFKDNRCNYCVAAHSAALKAIGVKDEEIKHIKNGSLYGF